MAIVWPIKILPPQVPRPHFMSHMNVSGPVSQDSLSDIISGDAGFWRASYGSIVVTTDQRVKVWNAIRALLKGRLNPILVPYCRRYQPIIKGVGGDPVPYSDGAFFSDGSGFVSAATQVVLTADLAKRAVSATVNVILAETIEPGQVFSLGERLYEIDGVTDVSGTTKTITFFPPARELVVAGTELNFTNPVCRMRLATDDAMQIDLDSGRRGFPSLDFVEDLLP